MRRYISRCLILLVFFFIVGFPLQTFAHTSETDGSMTVTLHIYPNDDPKPGKQANLNFLFSDATNKFKFSNCTCTVSITELGKHTYKGHPSTNPKSKSSVWGISMPYTFPSLGVYQIVLKGAPKQTGEFQPFRVSWYFRVDTVHPGVIEDDEKGPPDITVLLSALAAVVIGLILFGLFIKREYRSS